MSQSSSVPRAVSGRTRGRAIPPARRPDLPPERMQRRAACLAEAVRERRVMELLYGGAWRVVHPHALGRTASGRLSLLTWQTAGVARGPGQEGEGWRMFDVASIGDARVLHATFTPRPRAPGKGWTAGLPAPAAEVPTREQVLEAA